jgi:hypothetical protein
LRNHFVLGDQDYPGAGRRKRGSGKRSQAEAGDEHKDDYKSSGAAPEHGLLIGTPPYRE